MKIITIEELNEKKEKLKRHNELLKKLAPLIEELKEDEKVKKYIEADRKFEESSAALGSLIEEIKYQEMYHCKHFFVKNNEIREFDGHRTEITPILTCIHCGLTNKYIDDTYLDFSRHNNMNEVYIKSDIHYSQAHGFYDYKEMNSVKKLYDAFKSEYPEATDEDIEKHIALVKKMKGGKLC